MILDPCLTSKGKLPSGDLCRYRQVVRDTVLAVQSSLSEDEASKRVA
jgi:hypothetical protein